MPLTRKWIKTPTTAPARFGLLDAITPEAMPDHGALAGVEYDAEFCGRARPWVAPCATPTDLGSISVSVNNARLATITGTGEPAGTGYTIQWGAGTPDTNVALDGQTNTYAADGTYTVSVTGPDGYTAEVTITVTNGSASGPFTADAVDTKVADDGVDQTGGDVIALYHLHTCRLVGSDPTDREKRALRSLDLGASRALEEGFGDVIGAAAVDITPSGTAVHPAIGLALLEQSGGSQYGGRRVIHADLVTVALWDARGLLRQVDGHLETLVGSLVVAGPGYADSTGPSAPAAGARWAYATGWVHIYKGAEKVIPLVLASDPYDNEFKSLAERIYVPTYECFASAVETTLEA